MYLMPKRSNFLDSLWVNLACPWTLQNQILLQPGWCQRVSEIFQVFLGFANLYCHFIEAFNKVALGFLDMLKSGTKKKFKGIKFVFTGKALESFNELKHFFTYALMLVHYNPICHIMLECNASKFAILVIFSQLIKKTSQQHPIAFWSRKMALAEQNYRTGESEMLTVVESCKHQKHYLKGATYSIRVVTNHINL